MESAQARGFFFFALQLVAATDTGGGGGRQYRHQFGYCNETIAAYAAKFSASMISRAVRSQDLALLLQSGNLGLQPRTRATAGKEPALL